jgi:hypothetical protein
MIETNCSLFRQGGSAGTDNLRQIEKRSEQTRMEEKMDRTAEAGRRVPVQKQSCFAAILAHPTGPVFLPIPSCGRMTRKPEVAGEISASPCPSVTGADGPLTADIGIYFQRRMRRPLRAPSTVFTFARIVKTSFLPFCSDCHYRG